MAELVGADWNLSAQKRGFDIVGMTALLPVLAPLGAASVLAVATVDRMSPIYTSTRYGLDGEPFDFHKIRTMPEVTPETPSQGGHSDARATRLGSLLRKAHFDEIPQAINIYHGEMSLVGPRALIASDMEATMNVLSPGERLDWLWARATAKPASFGPFQLRQHANGYDLTVEQTCYERALCDIEYAKTATMRGDLGIIARSITEGIGSYLFKSSLERPQRGERTTALFTAVAEKMGVQLDVQEQAHWKTFLVAARFIDNAVDSGPNADVDVLIKDLLAGSPIGEMTQAETDEFGAVFGRKTALEKTKLLAAFKALPTFLARKRTASTTRDLMSVNQEESLLFASLLHLSTDGLVDELQRVTFNSWLTKFAEVGYLVDSALDLRRDYEAGNITLEPSLGGRTVLMRQGVVEGLPLLRAVPLRGLRKLARSATHTLSSGN